MLPPPLHMSAYACVCAYVRGVVRGSLTQLHLLDPSSLSPTLRSPVSPPSCNHPHASRTPPRTGLPRKQDNTRSHPLRESGPVSPSPRCPRLRTHPPTPPHGGRVRARELTSPPSSSSASFLSHRPHTHTHTRIRIIPRPQPTPSWTRVRAQPRSRVHERCPIWRRLSHPPPPSPSPSPSSDGRRSTPTP